MKPRSLSISMYNVGFGDCFLLQFRYRTRMVRSLLIDFGSLRAPKGKKMSRHMVEIARHIRSSCGGKLDAVVATHRHRDHISGFGGKSGELMLDLRPDLVLQPWTEAPDAPEDAGEASLRNQENRSYVRALKHAQDVDHDLLKHLSLLGQRMDTRGLARRATSEGSTISEAALIGELNLKNLRAVKNLAKMGAAGRSEYLRAGDESGLEEVLPGVRVHVLGPPDLYQYPAIQSYTRESEEFWLGMNQTLRQHRGDESPAPHFDRRICAREDRPAWLGWTIDRLHDIQVESARTLVTSIDRAINNTSLVLLFTIDGKSFLFSGDAEIESWNYIWKTYLEDEDNEIGKLIRSAIVYKVGHHGSRNATPKFLWEAFVNKRMDASKKELVTLLSTLSDVYGNKHTAVPSKRLRDVLHANSEMIVTDGKPDFCTERNFEFT